MSNHHRSLRIFAIESLAATVAMGGCTGDGREGAEPAARSLPYETEDIVISGSEAGTQLAGTLTWPTEGCPCPTAVLVQGAGSHDRDYTVFGHRPFRFLADHLARHGIATLRFDERGAGASSGNPAVATTADFTSDVMRWLTELRDYTVVDSGALGIVGHSEGGTIASLAAAQSPDLRFVIMLGSPGLPGRAYNLQFEESMGRAQGLDEETISERRSFQERILDVVSSELDSEAAASRLREMYREETPEVPEADLERGIKRLLSPWFRFNLAYDPARTLGDVRSPVLAVWGEKDAHVPPAGNREAMESILDVGSGRDRVVVLPDLNHFFQTAETGSPDEYEEIEETLAPSVLELIVHWIQTNTGERPQTSCTIFHAADENTVLAGNNEDWSDPLTRFWIIPGEGENNGWIKFGFAGGYPQGGMNDHGLFWDATGSPYLAMPYSEAHKVRYDGPLMEKVMAEAGSVEEAGEIFGGYFCDDQYRAQYLVGDSLGRSMIVEGDDILPKAGRFQVLTNFYQSHPDLGGYPCWRYDAATQILGQADELTPEVMGQVLGSTHQDGKYPTQYSMIYDLPRLRVYLFHFHDFQEFIRIDLEDELLKGARDYDLAPLFSKVELTAPANGGSVPSGSVVLKWQGRTASSYDICFSTSPNPSAGCQRVQPELASRERNRGVLFGTFAVFLGLLAWPDRRRCHQWAACFLLAFLGATACSGDTTGPGNVEPEVEEITHTVSGLAPGTTYYWNVRAQSAPSSGFSSETVVFSFTTTG